MKKLSRRSTLVGLAAVAPITAVATMPVEAVDAAPDPVFAAVDAHKAVMAKIVAIFDEDGEDQGDAYWIDWARRRDAATDQETVTLLAMLNTMPTTPVGLAYALAHIGAPPYARDEEYPNLLAWAYALGGIEGTDGFDLEMKVPAQSYLARLSTAALGMASATTLRAKAENHGK